MIYFTDTATHDHTFLAKPNLKPYQVAIFVRAYVDYKQYDKWTKEGIHFVTRLKDNALFEELEDLDISDSCPEGYIKDEKISIK